MSDNSRQIFLWPVSLARRLYAAGALEPRVRFERLRGATGHLIFQTRWGELGQLAITRTARDERQARELSATSARALLAKNFPGAVMN